MFERLKKAFTQDRMAALQPAAPVSCETAQWAVARGLAYTPLTGHPSGFSVTGKVRDKPWKLERGASSRNYIRGDELRARGELGINDEASVLIMTRPLKDSLEKLAYQMYTDTLQTTADPSLPEEMRWLAMYPEVGWDSLPTPFWESYAVMADKKAHAQAWIDPALTDLLMRWPDAAASRMPFILMLLRGKAYLRMQYSPSGVATLEHATGIFVHACEGAMTGLSADIIL